MHRFFQSYDIDTVIDPYGIELCVGWAGRSEPFDMDAWLARLHRQFNRENDYTIHLYRLGYKTTAMRQKFEVLL